MGSGGTQMRPSTTANSVSPRNADFGKRQIMIMPVSNARIYQIKIVLKRTEPPVWRRFQVRGDVSFYKQHRVVACDGVG